MPTLRILLPRKTERLLIGLGTALCVVFLLLRLYNAAGSRLGRMSFEAAHPARLGSKGVPAAKPSLVPASVDFSLWSEKRIRGYQEVLARQFELPVALLRIPRIHLEVPVFNGTDEGILNRGVGRIIGTAQVGQAGNLGIAGHRDGFFRALKDLEEGDDLELVTSSGESQYRIDNITIVTPDDVRILNDRGVPTITLVTCYPFYFVGDAPQRYVLQGSLQQK
jgi:sortase A